MNGSTIHRYQCTQKSPRPCATGKGTQTGAVSTPAHRLSTAADTHGAGEPLGPPTAPTAAESAAAFTPDFTVASAAAA